MSDWWNQPGYMPRSSEEARRAADMEEQVEAFRKGLDARVTAEKGPVRWWDHVWWYITGEGHVRAAGYWSRRATAVFINTTLVLSANTRIVSFGESHPDMPLYVVVYGAVTFVVALMFTSVVWKYMTLIDHVTRRMNAFMSGMQTRDVEAGTRRMVEADRAYRESKSFRRVYRAWRARSSRDNHIDEG